MSRIITKVQYHSTSYITLRGQYSYKYAYADIIFILWSITMPANKSLSETLLFLKTNIKALAKHSRCTISLIRFLNFSSKQTQRNLFLSEHGALILVLVPTCWNSWIYLCASQRRKKYSGSPLARERNGNFDRDPLSSLPARPTYKGLS